MYKRKPIPFILMTALCLALPASAQIYQWKDQNGKTVISDKPPADQTQAQRVNTYGPSENKKQPTLAEREMEFRKRQKDAQEKAEKTEKADAAAAEKNHHCQTARSQLRMLESGQRVAMRDEKGERYIIDDTQRSKEIERTKNTIEANCQQ